MATIPFAQLIAEQKVTVEQYEQTPGLFERHEYVDGQLIEKPVPTVKYSLLQGWLSILFWKYYTDLATGPELHSKVRSATWRIPDFWVQAKQLAQSEKYAYSPLLLTIEIRSPEDRWSTMLSKFEDYHEWGVPYCWLLDPESERAWTFHRGGDLEEVNVAGAITAGHIAFSLAEVFSVLRS